MKKWYVFDKSDCFDSFETAVLAAALADRLSTVEGLEGVHMAYMSSAEYEAYCITGKFPFSK